MSASLKRIPSLNQFLLSNGLEQYQQQFLDAGAKDDSIEDFIKTPPKEMKETLKEIGVKPFHINKLMNSLRNLKISPHAHSFSQDSQLLTTKNITSQLYNLQLSSTTNASRGSRLSSTTSDASRFSSINVASQSSSSSLSTGTQKTFNITENEIRSRVYGNCPKCGLTRLDFIYCINCKHKEVTNNWTSGIKDLDDVIRETQLNTKPRRSSDVYLKWIPYERLKNIQQIGKGGFSIVYKAVWLDHTIWDRNKYKEVKKTVALKRLIDSQSMSKKFLDEIKTHWKCDDAGCIKIIGMTQDPETKEYIIVMEYANNGDLRSFLTYNFRHMAWKDKLYFLQRCIVGLGTIHEAGIVHRDLHCGNVLVTTYEAVRHVRHALIADLGLSCPANATPSDIYGVLEYVAPEVLRNQPYTPAADIYSFGIIMCELSTGEVPYPDQKSKFLLAHEIVSHGLRPTIAEGSPQCYRDLTMQCLDADPDKRPTTKKLSETIYKWWNNLNTFESYGEPFDEITQQFIRADKLQYSNTKALYTSNYTSNNYMSNYKSEVLTDFIKSTINSIECLSCAIPEQ